MRSGVPPRVWADLKRLNPSDPANLEARIVCDGEWRGKNYVEVNRQYLDAIVE